MLFLESEETVYFHGVMGRRVISVIRYELGEVAILYEAERAEILVPRLQSTGH